jgi:hypothetical protein
METVSHDLPQTLRALGEAEEVPNLPGPGSDPRRYEVDWLLEPHDTGRVAGVDGVATCQRRSRAEVNQRQDRDILLECLVTLRHAAVFVRTRQKMHPTGVELYDQLVKDVERTLASPPAELPATVTAPHHD